MLIGHLDLYLSLDNNTLASYAIVLYSHLESLSLFHHNCLLWEPICFQGPSVGQVCIFVCDVSQQLTQQLHLLQKRVCFFLQTYTDHDTTIHLLKGRLFDRSFLSLNIYKPFQLTVAIFLHIRYLHPWYVQLSHIVHTCVLASKKFLVVIVITLVNIFTTHISPYPTLLR